MRWKRGIVGPPAAGSHLLHLLGGSVGKLLLPTLPEHYSMTWAISAKSSTGICEFMSRNCQGCRVSYIGRRKVGDATVETLGAAQAIPASGRLVRKKALIAAASSWMGAWATLLDLLLVSIVPCVWFSAVRKAGGSMDGWKDVWRWTWRFIIPIPETKRHNRSCR